MRDGRGLILEVEEKAVKKSSYDQTAEHGIHLTTEYGYSHEEIFRQPNCRAWEPPYH